jgi:hypothetical protein
MRPARTTARRLHTVVARAQGQCVLATSHYADMPETSV